MILIRGNIERIVESPIMIQKLKSEGFTELAGAGSVVPSEDVKISKSSTASELKAFAKSKGIAGATSLTKAELIDLLTEKGMIE